MPYKNRLDVNLAIYIMKNLSNVSSLWHSLLEDHVVVGVIEGVPSHHPHQARVHQSLMGRPTRRLS